MKNNFILTALLVLAAGLKAQTISQSVIASTGGFSATANNSFSYTVGEMTMIQTFTGSGTILTQGFQQPNDIATGLLNIGSNAAGDLVVYPNPAVDKIWFAFQFTLPGVISVSMTNVLGQTVLDVYHGDYESGKTVQTANLSLLSSGTYILTAHYVDRNSGSISILSKRFEIIR